MHPILELTKKTLQDRKTSTNFTRYTQLWIAWFLRPSTILPARYGNLRFQKLAHHLCLSGHPGQRRMYAKIRGEDYYSQRAGDVTTTVRRCGKCARNIFQQRKSTNPLQMFPVREPLVSVAIDILGPLTKSKSGRRFLLIITDRFSRLTQAVPIRIIDV